MNIQGFETVDSLPCLYHPDTDLLVLSDIHLGLEGSMTSEGAYVPKFQLKDILEDIETAKEKTEASRILVNGDLKNEFRKNYYSEKKEVDKLLSRLQKLFKEIIIIEGNHDNFLDEIIEKNGLEMKKKHIEDDILFVHGHEDVENPEDFRTLVIGHEHPALSLKDEIGVVEKVDCLLHGETDEGTGILVLPAFSSIANGTRINETPKHELLSPVLRNHVKVSRLKAIAISREAGIFEFPELGRI